MKTHLIYFLILFLPFIAQGQNQLLVNEQPYDSSCSEIKTQKFELDSGSFGERAIEKAEISGDCVILHVAYGGGCGKTNFELLQTSGIMESLPLQVFFTLKLKNEDTCKALIHQKISFDLLPLKKYATGAGIRIKIGSKHEVLYKK